MKLGGHEQTNTVINRFINIHIDNKVLHTQSLSKKRGGELVMGHIRGKKTKKHQRLMTQ